MSPSKPGFSCLAARGRGWGETGHHFKNQQELRREKQGSCWPPAPYRRQVASAKVRTGWIVLYFLKICKFISSYVSRGQTPDKKAW